MPDTPQRTRRQMPQIPPSTGHMSSGCCKHWTWCRCAIKVRAAPPVPTVSASLSGIETSPNIRNCTRMHTLCQHAVGTVQTPENVTAFCPSVCVYHRPDTHALSAYGRHASQHVLSRNATGA